LTHRLKARHIENLGLALAMQVPRHSDIQHHLLHIYIGRQLKSCIRKRLVRDHMFVSCLIRPNGFQLHYISVYAYAHMKTEKTGNGSKLSVIVVMLVSGHSVVAFKSAGHMTCWVGEDGGREGTLQSLLPIKVGQMNMEVEGKGGR